MRVKNQAIENQMTSFVDVRTTFRRDLSNNLISFDSPRRNRHREITPSTFIALLKNSIARRSAVEKSFVARCSSER